MPDTKPKDALNRDDFPDAVAVIGMAGRFPGAADIDEFWSRLRQGEELITFYSEEELIAEGIALETIRSPHYVKAQGRIEGADLFDAAFFGITPREAEATDPQQRISLECAWHALEDAACDPSRYSGRIGVYCGLSQNNYLLQNLLNNPAFIQSVGGLNLSLSNQSDHLSTRISYKLGLTGPSLTVQTACSTSLVAVHLACQALLNFQCEMALAGGVSVQVPLRAGYTAIEGGVLSPDGHCRPFDGQAQGTVGGSGVGMVALKRLEDALAEGDPIRAVIRGSSINNDGSEKVGFTAPGAAGQCEVIAEALAAAAVSSDTISYLEAHGTATPMGDPIEVEALTRAFGESTDRKGFCALSAVKSNLGHLDAAAGVTGLIKAVLALENQAIPPIVHYQSPNPAIDFSSTPFYPADRLIPWKGEGRPRRAGVSSFGMGGTNAHAVVEEAPPRPDSGSDREWKLLCLSARSEADLDNATANLSRHLQKNPDLNLADAAYTLQMGRKAFALRRVALCRDNSEAAELLESQTAGEGRSPTPPGQARERSVIFLFPGQGAQFPGMAAGLYRQEKVFRQEVDRCCELVQPHLQESGLADLLLADEGSDEMQARLRRTSLAQPALFVIEYALARQWMQWGIRPRAMLGHSIGEYVAACLAGVFTLEDALALVALRGRLMQELPAGAMLAVPMSEAQLRARLGDDLSLAAVNRPSSCVVSGPQAAIERLEESLGRAEVACRRLHTSHAFHSAMMEPILKPFARQVAERPRQAPSIPFVSNRSGSWISPAEAMDPEYWAGHLRHTVRFSQGLEEVFGQSSPLLLEAGPGQALASIARNHPARPADAPVVSSLGGLQMRRQTPDPLHLMQALGRLWMAGADLSWEGFHEGQDRRRVRLPLYPFRRKRFWIDPAPQPAAPRRPRPAGVAGYFYQPVWRQSVRWAVQPDFEDRRMQWLLFVDQAGLGRRLSERLGQLGQKVIAVEEGDDFRQLDEDRFALAPGQPQGYQSMLEHLQKEQRLPDRMLHLWGVTPENGSDSPDAMLERGFYSLLYLAQAWGRLEGKPEARILALTSHAQRVSGEGRIFPEKAAVLGACRVIPQEYPRLKCRCLDVVVEEPRSGQEQRLLDTVLMEAESEASEDLAAYRQGEHWVQSFEPLEPLLEAGENGDSGRLRQGGVYLVTGGLGGIGLEAADSLARRCQARLVLLGRSPFPAEGERRKWIEEQGEDDPVSRKIRRLEAMQKAGAEVLVLSADLSDREELAAALGQARQRFGDIQGVLHAAGLPGSGLIHLKTPEMAAEVLAPKVLGTRNLQALLAPGKLDFWILFSSLTAYTGGYGQADYTAANAYLDAFAQQRWLGSAGYTASVNWDAWGEVGMRMRSADQQGRRPGEQPDEFEPVEHPLLQRRLIGRENGEKETYSARLSPQTHWMLDEHRILGTPVLPGVAYLEMARAALQPHANGGPVELHEVYFVEPLSVEDDRQREVRTVVEKDDAGYQFRILGLDSGASWHEHAFGKGIPLPSTRAPQHDLTQLLAALKEPKVIEDDPRRKDPGFGARWHSLKKVHVGKSEVIGEYQLPDGLESDLDELHLHCGLLDRLVSSSMDHLTRESAFVPWSCRRITVWGPLPGRVFCRARPRSDSPSGTSAHDIWIMDEKGREVAAVEGFSFRQTGRLTEQFQDHADPPGGIGQAAAQQDGHSVGQAATPPGATVEEIVRTQVQELSVKDGLQALWTIVQTGRLPQLAVALEDPNQTLARLRSADAFSDVEEDDLPVGEAHQRPDLTTAYVAPRNDFEAEIASVWQQVLGIAEVGVHDNFLELGGDSVQVLQIVTRGNRRGLQLDPQMIFENPSVAELAQALGETQQAQHGRAAQEVPLTPIQRRFLDHLATRSAPPGNVLQLESPNFDSLAFEEALQAAASAHPALHLRLDLEQECWQEPVGEDVRIPLERVDLAGLAADALQDNSQRLASRLLESLDPAQGVLLRAALLEFGPRHPDRVLLAGHHLALDASSWKTLIDDLDQAYRQRLSGQTPEMPPEPDSYAEWATGSARPEQPEGLADQTGFWLRQIEGPSLPLPGMVGNPEASGEVNLSDFLDRNRTRELLYEAPQAYGTQTSEMLLAALALSLAERQGDGTLKLEIEDDLRRQDGDGQALAGTVGWLAAVFPLALPVNPRASVPETLIDVKERLRSVPQGGSGYGLLRWADGGSELARQGQGQAPPALLFQYLEDASPALRAEAPFTICAPPLPANVASRRPGQVSLSALLQEDELRIDWSCAESACSRPALQELARDFNRALQKVIDHCRSPEAGEYTPSDFPLMDLDRDGLSELIDRIEDQE